MNPNVLNEICNDIWNNEMNKHMYIIRKYEKELEWILKKETDQRIRNKYYSKNRSRIKEMMTCLKNQEIKTNIKKWKLMK